jgi:hypothetical protein
MTKRMLSDEEFGAARTAYRDLLARARAQAMVDELSPPLSRRRMPPYRRCYWLSSSPQVRLLRRYLRIAR